MEAPLAGLVVDALRAPLAHPRRTGHPHLPTVILWGGGVPAAFRMDPGAESPKVDGSGVRSDVELTMVNWVKVGRRGRHPGPGR